MQMLSYLIQTSLRLKINEPAFVYQRACVDISDVDILYLRTLTLCLLWAFGKKFILFCLLYKDFTIFTSGIEKQCFIRVSQVKLVKE